MTKPLLPLLGLALIPAVAGSIGCVSPNDPGNEFQDVVIEGDVSFAGDGAIGTQAIDFRVTVYGSGLFEGSPTCTPRDPSVPGTLSASIAAGNFGHFNYAFSMSSLRAVVDESCTLGPARLDQADAVEIEGAVPANPANCTSLCLGNGSGDVDACVADCSQGGRRIYGTKTLSGAEIQAAVSGGADLSADQVTLVANLVLDQVGPALPAGSGPDLQVDGDAASRSARIGWEYFAPDDCAIVEGCIREPGTRRVLRFDGVIQNMGDQDFVLGNPQGNSLFQYSACHGHFHLKEAMSYELLDGSSMAAVRIDGNAVVGHKQGFCMLDMIQVAGSESAKFNCSNQGLTSGWADVYSAGLDCQLVDITGVPAGEYVLKVTVNPGGSLNETNKSNNSAFVTVTIPAQ